MSVNQVAQRQPFHQQLVPPRRYSVDGKSFAPEYPASYHWHAVVGVYSHWSLEHYSSGADGNTSQLCATGRNLGSQYERYTQDPYTPASRTTVAAYESGTSFANKRLGWRAEACSSSFMYVCAIPTHSYVFNCKPPPPPSPPPSPPATTGCKLRTGIRLMPAIDAPGAQQRSDCIAWS